MSFSARIPIDANLSSAMFRRAFSNGVGVAKSSVDRNDERLVREIAEGREQALSRLFDLHGGPLFGLARAMVNDDAFAAQVVKETFVDAWNRATEFDVRKHTVFGWLVTLLRSKAAPHRKAAAPAAMQAPKDLSCLDDEQRRYITLAYFHGLGLAEIAAMTGETIEQVKPKIVGAMRRLREHHMETQRGLTQNLQA